MKKRNGFTFIEILVTIAVFSIGVLAVLNLIVNNLGTVDKSETKIKATLLAKEGIEIIYNMRDSNIQKGLDRNCVIISGIDNNGKTSEPNLCDGYFGSGISNNKILQVSFDPKGYIQTKRGDNSDFNNNFSGNRLYFFTGIINGSNIFRYGNENNLFSGEQTFFARYILFTGINEDKNILPVNKILKLESHVLLKKGSYTGEIVLESFIGNH
ncbi:MAG: prepilin-type N-terminal cleavage/methylation domain-containing protein [Candidatus Absconditabacterales bacterium]